MMYVEVMYLGVGRLRQLRKALQEVIILLTNLVQKRDVVP